MKARSPVLGFSILVLAWLAAVPVPRAQASATADTVAAITQLENDAVKADLAGDKAFYEKVLAADWTGGDSGGTWYSKPDVLKMMSDAQHNKTNSENISELKVRDYGNTAVATYKTTYDAIVKGEHRARTVISTDTFVKMHGEWKQIASHSTQTK
ncbi:MAG: nuclear transport factor 2 family protein [Bryobacteraceae bacterium]|jgi:hypothetical protein